MTNLTTLTSLLRPEMSNHSFQLEFSWPGRAHRHTSSTAVQLSSEKPPHLLMDSLPSRHVCAITRDLSRLQQASASPNPSLERVHSFLSCYPDTIVSAVKVFREFKYLSRCYALLTYSGLAYSRGSSLFSMPSQWAWDPRFVIFHTQDLSCCPREELLSVDYDRLIYCTTKSYSWTIIERWTTHLIFTQIVFPFGISLASDLSSWYIVCYRLYFLLQTTQKTRNSECFPVPNGETVIFDHGKYKRCLCPQTIRTMYLCIVHLQVQITTSPIYFLPLTHSNKLLKSLS